MDEFVGKKITYKCLLIIFTVFTLLILIGCSHSSNTESLINASQNYALQSKKNLSVSEYASVYIYCENATGIYTSSTFKKCPNIKINEQSIGEIKEEFYTRLSLAEGEYELVINFPAYDQIRKQFKAGEDYYFKLVSSTVWSSDPLIEIKEMKNSKGTLIAKNSDLQIAKKYAFKPNHISKNQKRKRVQNLSQSTNNSSDNQTFDLKKLLKQSAKVPSRPNRYALSIGIENYFEAPEVPFANKASELFAKIAGNHLGVPEQNIVHISKNATAGVIRGRISTLLNRLDSDDTLYFYYTGHGVPGQKGKEAYLLPKDAVVGAYEDPDFALDNLYDKFANSDVGQVYAFVDACFSGQASPEKQIFDGVAPAGRTAKSLDQNNIPDNFTLMTAGKNNQFANVYTEKKFRLFSYFLMKGILKDREGGNLVRYVRSKVSKRSRLKGPAYQQMPQVYGNLNLSLPE